MLNQVVLVGRLADEPASVELENGHKKITMDVIVPRSYKNEKGEYDSDRIRCLLWDQIATTTKEFCHKGDIVGVKGRIQVTEINETEDTIKYITEVIAEKITFLSSKKEEKEGEENE